MVSASIFVRGLHKTYTVHRRSPGLRGAVKALISRETCRINALKGISFEVNEKEIVGIIGPNGAGKSSLLKILSGIMPADSGEVTVLGYDPFTGGDSYKRQISMVMGQKNQLFWDLPALESYRFHKILYRIPDNEFNKRLDALVSVLNAGELLTIPVRQLSLGQRMQLELIIALLHFPKIVFLDEPLLGIDILTKQVILDFLDEFRYNSNSTILYTTHVMAEVERLCDRTILIDKGSILHDGPTEHLHKLADATQVLTVVSKEISQHIVKEWKQKYNARVTDGQLVMHVAGDKVKEMQRMIADTIRIDSMTVSSPSIEDVLTRFFKEYRSGAS